MAKVRLEDDGSVVEIRPDGSKRQLPPRSDWSRVDATTDQEIARHATEDDADARRDAAAWVRHVRKKLGLSQRAFAARIGVPVDTVRNWEQGKRLPRGPARALLRILDHAPKAALAALHAD